MYIKETLSWYLINNPVLRTLNDKKPQTNNQQFIKKDENASPGKLSKWLYVINLLCEFAFYKQYGSDFSFYFVRFKLLFWLEFNNRIWSSHEIISDILHKILDDSHICKWHFWLFIILPISTIKLG